MADIIPTPKWIQKRYAILWNTFKDKEFTHEQATKILKEDNEKGINVFISDLRKAGWIETKFNEEDYRKKVYKLKSPNDIYGDMKA